MSQSDLCFTVGGASLRCESEFVKQSDQAIDRLLGSRRLARRAGHPASPRTAGLERLGASVAVGGKADGEDLGEQLIAPSPTRVHPADRAEHQRRTAGASVIRFNTFHPALGDQGVQVESDRVRMHPKLFRDRRYRHRAGRTPHCGQHVLATTGDLIGRPGGGAHPSALGSLGHQRRVHAEGADLGCPAWRPQRRVTARQGVGEEGRVIAQVWFQLLGEVVLVVDRLDRAHRFTGAAVHAFVGVDIQGAAAFVDAVDRTLLNAGAIHHVDTWLTDHVRHGLEFIQ